MSNTALLGSYGGQGNSSLMFRNKIINGAMVIDQRNAGAAVTGGGYTYTLDRWLLWTGAASKFSAQRSSVVPANFVNSLLCTSLSAYTPGATERMWLSQPIEGSNVGDLGWGTASAQSISISFWVRSSLTGTFSTAVMNSAGNRSYVATYSISAANTWEYKTVVIPGDTSGTWLTDTGVGLYLNFDLGSGSNYNTTAGAWTAANVSRTSGTVSLVGTNGATLYITGVQLEAETATPFERRPIGVELSMCQRYFEKSFAFNTAPANGANATSFSTNVGLFNGVSSNYNGSGASHSFRVEKRIVPNIVKYGNSNGHWAWYAAADVSLTWSANAGGMLSSTGGFQADQQVLAGQLVFIRGHWTADAEL